MSRVRAALESAFQIVCVGSHMPGLIVPSRVGAAVSPQPAHNAGLHILLRRKCSLSTLAAAAAAVKFQTSSSRSQSLPHTVRAPSSFLLPNRSVLPIRLPGWRGVHSHDRCGSIDSARDPAPSNGASTAGEADLTTADTASETATGTATSVNDSPPDAKPKRRARKKAASEPSAAGVKAAEPDRPSVATAAETPSDVKPARRRRRTKAEMAAAAASSGSSSEGDDYSGIAGLPQERRAGGQSQLEESKVQGAASSRGGAQLLQQPDQLPRVNLTAGAPEDLSAWQGIKQWVVFSDLHVSSKTVDVCVEVLDAVHREALQRNAGILFLGDFWHARGSLPVDPLNKVLAAVRNWQRPTLMLVGNHDQVTLGGLTHALTPLAAANPLIHVVDSPALFLDALWLPFRRDHRELQAAVAQAGPVSAVFGHADVIGAFMNDAFQAASGLEPDVFPAATPTYLGHYHVPHVVAKNGQPTNIQYVGSPYQVSRSEAGQHKALLVLDHTWREVPGERIPLTIGPRHYSAVGAGSPALAGLKPGDRLKWTIAEDTLESLATDVQALRDAGVEVTVVVPPAAGAPRIQDAEDIAPLQLFQQYVEAQGLLPQAVAEGEAMLQQLPAGLAARARGKTNIVFDSVKMEGYGPFRDSTTYPLADRSLRLVVGRNADEAASDSNGSGKTTLVMAPLWALTGRSDARAEGGGGKGLTNADVVNDACKSARVVLRGTVNGKAFTIDRAVRKRGGGGHLTFVLDGQDLTKAEKSMTNAAITEAFSTDLLTRAVFFGQTEVNALLEANDEDFKTELAKLVGSDLWDAARLVARDRKLAASKALAAVHGELRVRDQNVANSQSRLDAAHAEAATWEEQQRARLETLQLQIQNAEAQLHSSFHRSLQHARELRAWLRDASLGLIYIPAATSDSSPPWMERRSDSDAGQALAAEVNTEAADVSAAEQSQQQASFPEEELKEAARRDILVQEAAAEEESSREALIPSMQLLDRLQARLADVQARWSEQNGRYQVALQQLQEYQMLTALTHAPTHVGTINGQSSGGSSGGSGSGSSSSVFQAQAVCDRCMQPIDEAMHAAGVQRLQAAADLVKQGLAVLESEESAVRVELQRQQEVMRSLEERHRHAAAIAAALRTDQQRHLMEAASRQTQRLWDAQRAADAVRQAREELSRRRAELEGAQAAVQAALAAFSAAIDLSDDTSGNRRLWDARDDKDIGAGDRLLHSREAFELCVDVTERFAADAQSTRGLVAALEQQVDVLTRERNSAAAQAAMYEGDLKEETARQSALLATRQGLELEERITGELQTAFGGSGIKSFLLESVLGSLQDRTQAYLSQVAPQFSLTLSATRPSRAGGGSTEIEKISKSVMLHPSATASTADQQAGQVLERSVRQLSGGERRRVAVALALGFADLVSQRGNLQCNLLVLDEVMQHMDDEGCGRLTKQLKQLPRSSVLVVGQAGSFAARHIDDSDTVIKEGGFATVQLNS